MKMSQFLDLLDNLEQETAPRDKKVFVQTAAGKNSFTSKEVKQILNTFPFAKDQLQALETLTPQISDVGNAFQFMDVFTFIQDKREASLLLGHPEDIEPALNKLKFTELAEGIDMPPPIEDAAFSSLIDELSVQTFHREQLYLIEVASFRNTFTTDQVTQIINIFRFPKEKLRALKILRYRITDLENVFLIISAFSRHLDKKKASELLN